MLVLIRYLLFFLALVYLYKKLKLFFLAGAQNHQNTDSTQSKYQSHNQNPYSILEVSRNANQEEISKAYKQKIAEYHPDKVNHLGKEIQDIAQQKTQQINWAYNQLKPKKSTYTQNV